MRAFNWLKRLRKSERGNVLVLGGAALPLLVGSAGLSIDAIQMTLWKRQLQRAADSAAIAGAYAMSQGAAQGQAVANDLDEHFDYDLEHNEAPTITNKVIEDGSYGNGALSEQTCAARPDKPSVCFNRAVQVDLTAQRWLPFMSIFTKQITTFQASAAAALVTQGEFCMISLYNGTDIGIDNNGGGKVFLGCGMATNSRHATEAVRSGGSSETTASPIAAVGGITGGKQFKGNTILQPFSSPQEDPLAWVPTPSPSNCNSAVDVGTQEGTDANPIVIPAGCHTSMNIKGTAKLAPGTHYVMGDIDWGSQAKITGTDVTIVMTGPNGAAGDFKYNAGAEANLTAPTSGEYNGILFYRDRRASTIDIKINGGAASKFSGAIYMPTSDIDFAGHASTDVACVQIVGRKLKFRGSSNFTNTCSGGDDNNFQTVVVRLVR